MSVLDGLKNKIIGRKDDDYDDFRSRILNEENKIHGDKHDDYDRRFEKRFGEAQEVEPELRPFELEDRNFRNPVSMDREPVSLDTQSSLKREENSYEIIDKLNFIENQLSAIKSQTELLNERLKNIESKLGMQRRW